MAKPKKNKMIEDKNKRIVNEVRKLTIEGLNKDQQVVMREELSDEELNAVAGGDLSDYFAKMKCKTKSS